MLKRKAFSVLLSIVAILLVSHPLAHGDRRSEIYREIIVMFKADVLQFPKGLDSGNLDQVQISSPRIATLLREHRTEVILRAFPDFQLADTLGFTPDGQPVYLCDLSHIYKIRLSEESSRDSLIRDLTTLREVVYAEPNGMAQPASPLYPDDPLFEQGYQWALHNYGQSGGTADADIDAPEAWEITTGSSNVKIGIIDGGVDNSHEDLNGKVSGDAGWGWGGHGFHVAGIAAAKTDNDIGIAGVDWNARIISQRIDQADHEGTYNAIMDAVNAGAVVLNNSWGHDPPGEYSTTVRLAFANAYKLNTVAVASMGNDATSQVQYPAGYGQGIIAVGGTDRFDGQYSQSNTGNHIDVCAPGVDIMSCVPFPTEWGYYVPWNGTSMAAPHVSGLASLLKGYDPDLYNDDIEQIIRISADEVPQMGGQEWTPEFGNGRINARAALDLLQPPNYLAHWTATSGYQAGVTDWYTACFSGVSGLAPGIYIVKRYDMRHDVTFPQPFTSTPHAWGRGVATVGFSPDELNYGMGYCEFISVTSTGGTLRTWVYDVYTIDADNVGWIPCARENVYFAYSLLGQPNLLAPSLSVNLVQESDNHYFHLTWADENEFHEGYKLECKRGGGCWESVIDLPSTCDFYNYTPMWGSQMHYFRVRANLGEVVSSWSNEVNILNVPNAPATVQVSLKQVCGWPGNDKLLPQLAGEPSSSHEDVVLADSSETHCDNAPAPEPQPPCFPTNKAYVSWDPPEYQVEPVEYYKVRLLLYIGGIPAVYWAGPYSAEACTLCLWPNKQYWVNVVAYALGLHSDEVANTKSVTTGETVVCTDYDHKGTLPETPEPGEPTIQASSAPSDDLQLHNRPNPFNPETDLSYNLPDDCTVRLVVYNTLGQKVRVLADEHQQAGLKTIHWDGRDDGGNELASGVYFCRLQAGRRSATKKMILMR